MLLKPGPPECGEPLSLDPKSKWGRPPVGERPSPHLFPGSSRISEFGLKATDNLEPHTACDGNGPTGSPPALVWGLCPEGARDSSPPGGCCCYLAPTETVTPGPQMSLAGSRRPGRGLFQPPTKRAGTVHIEVHVPWKRPVGMGIKESHSQMKER